MLTFIDDDLDQRSWESREDCVPDALTEIVVGRDAATARDRDLHIREGEVPSGPRWRPFNRDWQRFASCYESVGAARRYAACAAQEWGVDVVETVELLVSELVTNAVKTSICLSKYAEDDYREREDIFVRLSCLGASLVIEVWDRDKAKPVLEDQNLTAERGRGLFLVDALSTRWAYYCPQFSGKVVWCAVRVPSIPYPTVSDEVGDLARIFRVAGGWGSLMSAHRF